MFPTKQMLKKHKTLDACSLSEVFLITNPPPLFAEAEKFWGVLRGVLKENQGILFFYNYPPPLLSTDLEQGGLVMRNTSDVPVRTAL